MHNLEKEKLTFAPQKQSKNDIKKTKHFTLLLAKQG